MNLFNWKKEKKAEVITAPEELELTEGMRLMWVMEKDKHGRVLPSTLKWAFLDPKIYNTSIRLTSENLVLGFVTKYRKDQFKAENFDKSILDYLVKIGEEDKLDKYIVLEAHGLPRNYVLNTDRYFQNHLKGGYIYDFAGERLGLPKGGEVMGRAEAEKYLYKSGEEKLLASYLFATLYQLDAKNTFRIKCLDVNEVYQINTRQRQVEFEQALKDYKLYFDPSYNYSFD